MTREELEDTLAQARGFGGFGLVPLFASILVHDQQQREEIRRLREALDWSVLKVDNTALRQALNELGPTGTKAEAYVQAAVEHVIYMRDKAHAALKEGHDVFSSP